MSKAIYSVAEMLVRGWVKLYLLGMPAQARRERQADIASDLFEYRRHVLVQGRSLTAAAQLLIRCVTGAWDDIFWRSEQRSAVGGTRILSTLRTPGSRLMVSIGIALTAAMAIFEGPVPGLVLGIFVASGLALYLKSEDVAYRLGGGLALAAVFALVLGSLSLGILGADGGQRADLMYIGVFAVGIVGALFARLRPSGMARALSAAALAQATVTAIALIAGAFYPAWWSEATGMQHPNPAYEIVGLNAFFITLFLASAVLFRAAAGGRTSDGASSQG